MVNWNADVITGFIAAIVVFVGIPLFIRAYMQRKYQFYLALALIFAAFSLNLFFKALSILFLSESLHLDSIYAALLAFPASAAFYDIATHERLGVWKMSCAFMIFVAVIAASFVPGSVIEVTYPTGEPGLTWAGWLSTIGVLGNFFADACIIVPVLRIYYHSPRSMKRSAFAFIVLPVLSILAGIHSALSGIFPLPGFENTLVVLIGILLFWTFIKNPQLGFVLPFKVSRLTILSTTSGIAIFDHVWATGQQMPEDGLYGGMLQGISTILQESIGKGNVQEIRLQQATLILNYDEQSRLAFVLISTKPTKTLRQAIDYFTSRFFERFGIVEFNGGDVTRFDDAEELVKECFAFIPE